MKRYYPYLLFFVSFLIFIAFPTKAKAYEQYFNSYAPTLEFEGISDLLMYLKDDSFVISWSDTSYESVKIEIIDEETSELIDCKSKASNTNIFTISPDVKKIKISISSDDESIKHEYLFDMQYSPNAIVSYESVDYTNKSELTVHCSLNDTYAVLCTLNDVQITHTALLDKGEYDFDIPLENGKNVIRTYIVDSNGNMHSTDCSIEYDTQSPVLELASIKGDTSTAKEEITIDGYVYDCDKLYINNQLVMIEPNGYFSYCLPLEVGFNNLYIIGIDKATNYTCQSFWIYREEQKKESITNPIISFVIFIILLLYLVFIIREFIRTKNNILERKNNLYSAIHLYIFIIFIYFLFTKILVLSVVASGSMEPALMTGNTTIYNRLAYVNNTPGRGDIVIFWSDEYNAYYGKRIIGLPGDELTFQDGHVYINGILFDESEYISSEINTVSSKTFFVPDNCYFMLGDCREYSIDSRYWEYPYISIDQIKGKLLFQTKYSFYNIFTTIFK